jgi:diacylglycerol kinase
MRERNMRIHLCFAFYVICAGFATQLSPAQWAAVLICIGVVSALECLNTALEILCDAVCPEKNRGIAAAKDVSAAAVLFAAVSSAAAGGVIFFSPERLACFRSFLQEMPLVMAAIVLTLIPAFLFVILPKRGKK